ncbi:MAG: Ig domain-containing protein [Deinococcales bacterium]
MALATFGLSGCTGDLNTPGEALRILGAGLPPAYVGQPYDQPVQAVGGLRPYDFALADGQLPPGLQLQGGTLRGTPSKTGRYSFTLQVTDANLSKTVQKYTLSVAELPPPSLTFNVPNTEIDHRITLRVQLRDAHQLEGVRTQVRWDAQRFQLVDGSVRASRQGLALLHQASPGELQVAVIPLGTTLSGEASLFQFDLAPTAGASFLKIDAQTEFASVKGHDFAKTSEGRQPPPPSSGSSDTTAPTGSSGGSTP